MRLFRTFHERPIHAKLIFNPAAGLSFTAPGRLVDAITGLQAARILPEVYAIEAGGDLRGVLRNAIRRGIGLMVVCGGDGTVDSVAATLAIMRSGSFATLGIIPAGTQNNVALSLGIPLEIRAAAARLRSGQRSKIDLGLAESGGVIQPFVEACSVGLFSALFPSADDIQHGNLARIGDFFSTLVSSQPAAFHLVLDSRQVVDTQGHVVLVSNTPYVGPHYRASPQAACDDGLLDVKVFAGLTLLDLVGYVVQVAGGAPEDPRVQHYQARQVEIETHPPMPVLVDGVSMGEGFVRLTVRRNALAVIH